MSSVLSMNSICGCVHTALVLAPRSPLANELRMECNKNSLSSPGLQWLLGQAGRAVPAGPAGPGGPRHGSWASGANRASWAMQHARRIVFYQGWWGPRALCIGFYKGWVGDVDIGPGSGTPG